MESFPWDIRSRSFITERRENSRSTVAVAAFARCDHITLMGRTSSMTLLPLGDSSSSLNPTRYCLISFAVLSTYWCGVALCTLSLPSLFFPSKNFILSPAFGGSECGDTLSPKRKYVSPPVALRWMSCSFL